ncbi:MAG: tetratricopeptide repeat protein [Paludibacter sp.]
MKRNIIFISLMLSFGSVLMAQSNALKQANALYTKGEYTEAAKQYERILTTEGVAPELYLNLGNAYYKSNETGKCILNYERALRLSPTFEDARYNLETAQLKVVDNVSQNQSFFIGKWIDSLIKNFNSNEWFWTSLIFFLLCLGCAFLFIFGSSRAVRKSSFYIGSILLAISMLTVFFAGIRKDQLLSHREAIVLTGTVSVKGSPDKSGTDLFQLHEGTKVTVKSTLGSWVEIKLGNGNVGWVEQENIERI